MAVELYLSMAGVEGDVKSRNHKGWIEILTCDWALARVRRADSDRNGAVTKGNEIKIAKAVGMETPALMTLCATGTVTPEAIISIVPAVGKRELQQKYIQLKCEHVVVRSLTTTASHEESIMGETLTLGFRSMVFEYFPQAARDQGGQGATAKSHAFAYDFAAQGTAAI